MNELWRLLLLVTIAGAAVTFLGSASIWFMDEERRIRRALRHVLKSEPEVIITARGRGRGVGFSFSTGLIAVAWDSGAWCLIYRIDELMGAELLVDGQIIGRVFRGEARRAIDQVVKEAAQVNLRLIFDDPRHPDFELDLWLSGDEQRRESRSPAHVIQEANRWLARVEAIVRRPIAPSAPAAAAANAATKVATRAPEPSRPQSAPVIPFTRDDDDDLLDPPFTLEAEPADAPEPPRPVAAPVISLTPPTKKPAPATHDAQDDLPFDLGDDDERDRYDDDDDTKLSD